MFTQVSPRVRRTIIIGLAALFVYAQMVFGTLSKLEEIAGLVPFDLRPTGYSPTEARALLSALGEQGRSYYLERQMVLDLFYPVLLALTLSHLLSLIKPRPNLILLRRICLGLVWCAALFDYLENLGIATMLMRWPTVPDALIINTSFASVLKAGTTTAGLVVLLVVFVCSKWGQRYLGNA